MYALLDLHYDIIVIIIDVSYPFKYVFPCACLSYLNSRFLVYWLLFAFVGSPSFVYGYLLYPNKLLDWIEWLANFQRLVRLRTWSSFSEQFNDSSNWFLGELSSMKNVEVWMTLFSTHNCSHVCKQYSYQISMFRKTTIYDFWQFVYSVFNAL